MVQTVLDGQVGHCREAGPEADHRGQAEQLGHVPTLSLFRHRHCPLEESSCVAALP